MTTSRARTAPDEREAIALLAGGPLRYTLRRSPRARGLRVTIHPERGVIASVPAQRRHGWVEPEAAVAAFLGRREPWLRRHLERQADARRTRAARPRLGEGRPLLLRGVPHEVVVEISSAPRRGAVDVDPGARRITLVRADGDRRTSERLLEAWLRTEARRDLAAAIERHAPAIGVTPASVTVRDTRTRWGSCSRRGALSFCWRLVLAPPESLEAVVVHELCHLRVFGHGPRFRTLVARYDPDHAPRRRWLREHADELHHALDDAADATAA